MDKNRTFLMHLSLEGIFQAKQQLMCRHWLLKIAW
jgi:hypothetical protein